jgi:hypothetical protein
MEPILRDWQDNYARLFGRHTLRLNHRLHESGLFTDEALARLIERCPASNYNLHAMGSPDDPRMTWRRGEIGDCEGTQVIDGIRAGRLWLNLRRVHEIDARYADLLQRMFAEFEMRVPGLSTYKHNLGILISSPRAQVYYHADVPGQALWQIRGTKRVWIYPNTDPFLPEKSIEDIVLGTTEEELPYEPWFDDYAQVFDLEPGQMLHWGLNGPHRVVNHDCLNVSVTTEHWAADIRNSYAVRYANALLRKYAGVKNPAVTTQGPMLYAKAALAVTHRAMRRQAKASSAPTRYDFRLDRDNAGRILDVPPAIAAE